MKKFKVKPGDTIYYLTEGGVESDIAMIIDGHEIVTSDYGYLNMKDCLQKDDPRVLEYIKVHKTD